VEHVEEPAFRARFGGQGAGALDWPPLAAVRAAPRVRFYTPP
jgi:hypothetical protein